MFVIGTAGHVDHGKSTLVQALTGIDPDRLREEKEREMTIDLGFAWLMLGGSEVGVVDVPGHRDFIENMLAGVGGIDLALFVVAADEGVMPQTKEHLAILDLLEIKQGIVVLTKVDLIDDPEWLELVTLDVAEAFEGTVLEDAPIIPVSAHNGSGIEALLSQLQAKLASAEPRQDLGRPRLPIDRVFTLSGFGTVVTGTLINGRFSLGDSVEIHPGGKTARIRGLQTHKTKLDTARPGSRVAINLTGVNRNDVQRGQIVAAPGVVNDTILFDASYRHLADAQTPLKHNMEVKLFVGATEVIARTRVLGTKQIEPGQTGWLQLALRESVAVVRGDRFILRRPSPGATLGGGRVLDSHPGRRHRRFRHDIVDRLETLAKGTPAELLFQALQRVEPVGEIRFLQTAGMEKEAAQSGLSELIGENQVVRVGKYLLTGGKRTQLQEKTGTILNEYHQTYPLRSGIPREELRSRLGLQAAVFNPFVEQMAGNELLVEAGKTIHLPNHAVTFSAEQQTMIDRLLRRFATSRMSSPSAKECKTAVSEDVFNALVELGTLHALNKEVVYAQAEYGQIIEKVKRYLEGNGRINAAETRDLFKTSRKYAIAILEHLDDIRITRRVDDYRELR